MSHTVGSLNPMEHREARWITRTTLGNAVEAARYFVTLMKQAAVRERTRRQLEDLDPRMLWDIGLDPLDVYRGGRGPGR
jgi:uncharacterized protein YjiS (DUF1127 family)